MCLGDTLDRGSLAPAGSATDLPSSAWACPDRGAQVVPVPQYLYHFRLLSIPKFPDLPKHNISEQQPKWQNKRAKVCNSSKRLILKSPKGTGIFSNLTQPRSALHPLPRRPPSHLAQHQHRQVAEGRPAAARVRRRPPLRPRPAPQRRRHQEDQARPQGRPEHQGPQAPRARPREGRGDRRQDVQQGPQEQEGGRQHRQPQEGLG